MEITQDNTEGFIFENYGKTLTFNVTTDKAGLYECKFNQHNDIDRKFTVIVECKYQFFSIVLCDLICLFLNAELFNTTRIDSVSGLCIFIDY